MAITAAELLVKVGADTDQAERDLKGFGERVKDVMGGLAMAATAGVAAAAAGLGAIVISGMGDAREAIAISKQTAAVIKSTGGIAGMTERSIARLATSMSSMTNFEDDAIQSGENLLLTFTNIGSDVFPQATQTMLDMSQALGQDLSASAMQLGKALNDPLDGLAALGRVGVQFTKDQEEMIKSMVEAGDTMGAQKVILAELNREFGGSAQAAADPITQLSNAWGNFKEAVATAIIPTLNNLAVDVLPMIASATEAVAPAFEQILEFGRNLKSAYAAVSGAQKGDKNSVMSAVSAYLTLPENWQTKVDQVNAAIDAVQAMGTNLQNAFTFFEGMNTGNVGKAVAAFEALPKAWQSMTLGINMAVVTPVVTAIEALVSGAQGLATIPTFIAKFQDADLAGWLEAWAAIPNKLKPIANALNTFVTSVKAFAAIAGGVGVLPAMTLTIKSADAEGAGRKAGASFREGIEAALNADGGIFGGAGAGFMGGGAIASFSMAGAEAGKAFREEIQAKGFEPAMADLNAQIASSEIGKLNTAITDYVSNWFAGFEAELITMEPPGWVTDINTWWESVKSYEPGWVTTLNAWQEKVSAMFGGGITVPEDVTHPKIQDTRGAGGWWDDLVPTLKGLLQFGGPIIGAKMPNVTAQITQLDTGGLPQSGGAPAIDVNALVGAIQLDPVAAQDFANVTLPKLPFALGGYAGITGPLQAPSAEELTLKVPELPKWEWPELPKWVWPTLPRWEWPSIPAPGWLSQLGVDRPGWLGELIAWHPVVTVVPGTVPANASGVRNFGGGLSWVGERGPELVYLPRGANVYSNEESRGMVGAATVNIYANGYSATDARRLALEVARILGRNF